MWLVAGLGNPGDEYAGTRHNIGYIVIDSLAARFSIPLIQKTANAIYGTGFVEDQKAIVMKPLTFMNNSGLAVKEVLFRFDGIENLIVIHDDLDLDTGVLRIKKTGSAGGHKGVQSIVDYLNSKDFIRLKLGIGRSERMSPEKYVLRNFNKQEKVIIDEAVESAVDAISAIITRGVSRAQNIYHRSL